MTIYTQTPDYYNDYLAHYGVKGMKWKNRKGFLSLTGDKNPLKIRRKQNRIERAKEGRKAKTENTIQKIRNIRLKVNSDRIKNNVIRRSGIFANIFKKSKKKK